jgi:ribosomal protein S18 acetylase RimI-like enzyme
LLTRSFKKGDEDAVVALWQDCGLTRPWNDPGKDIARKLTVQPELFLVGEVDGRIVATIMSGYDGHRGWVNYLAIAQGYRRQGFGRVLMQEAEERLVALGCPKLNVQVRKSNAEALGFYRSLGYAQDEAVSLGKRLIPDQPQDSCA